YRLDDPVDVLPQALNGSGLEITCALRTDGPASFTVGNSAEIDSPWKRIVNLELVRKHRVDLDRCRWLHITGNCSCKMNRVYRAGTHGLAVVRQCLVCGWKRLGFRNCGLGCRTSPVSLSLFFEGRQLLRSLVPEVGHPYGLKAASMAGIARN